MSALAVHRPQKSYTAVADRGAVSAFVSFYAVWRGDRARLLAAARAASRVSSA
jgi:hypothetical protein